MTLPVHLVRWEQEESAVEEGRGSRRFFFFFATIGGKPPEELQPICRGVSLVGTGAKTDPHFPAKKRKKEPSRAELLTSCWPGSCWLFRRGESDVWTGNQLKFSFASSAQCPSKLCLFHHQPVSMLVFALTDLAETETCRQGRNRSVWS